ncbi:unnamed protein product [Ixodes hexagonus]
MEVDPRKAPKRKTKKTPKKLLTTDDESTAERATHSSREAGGKRSKIASAPTTVNNQPSTSTAIPEEAQPYATFRSRLGQAQLDCVNAIAPVGATLSREQLAAVTSAVQHLSNICTDLIARNAYLEGRLETVTKNEALYSQRRTYSKAAKDQNTAGKSQSSDASVEAFLTPKQNNEEKVALLIYPQKPSEGREFVQVSLILKSSIAPEDLGLHEPVLKPIRGGAVLTSPCKEGIEKLEQTLTTNPTFKHQLKAKRPYSRNPQLKIREVVTADPAIIRRKLLSQNKLQGTEEDIQIVHTFEGNNGLSTLIVEVTPSIFNQLHEKQRIFLDWTSCPFEENLRITFCKNCSCYGHTATQCQADVRCCNCGQNHPQSECRAKVYKCPCSTDAPQSDKSKRVDTRTQQCQRSAPSTNSRWSG